MRHHEAKVGDKVWCHFLYLDSGSYDEFPVDQPREVEVISLYHEKHGSSYLWRVRLDDSEYTVYPVDCEQTREEAIAAYKRADNDGGVD